MILAVFLRDSLIFGKEVNDIPAYVVLFVMAAVGLKEFWITRNGLINRSNYKLLQEAILHLKGSKN
jgi:hypothetical protein